MHEHRDVLGSIWAPAGVRCHFRETVLPSYAYSTPEGEINSRVRAPRRGLVHGPLVNVALRSML